MTVSLVQVDDEVVRVHCRTWRGAAVGYDVSAYAMRGVLVDTGFPRVRHDFLRVVADLPLHGAVVTHQHEDHAGGAAALAERMPLHMHARCEQVLRERPDIGFYRRSIWGRPDRLTVPLVPFDPAPLEVVALPGHTPDHLGVWDPERRILASGDLFLGVKVRVAHHDESPAVLIQSLRRAAALEPRLLLDAHRGPLPNPVPLLRAKADWLEATMELVAGLAARGLGEREITRRVLGREELVGWVSAGEYSRRSLVQAMLRDTARIRD
ncbi:MAG: Zn-dependent hydrolase, glyoxylase [Gemmatimonadetes bacterium]|jgi:glyoxylase-like metal-dependent hydrolase (beta-lactamase superfamily II)|nr:Zn-dependent hydrolase, glyoxylase [Gemmatimonadota bacterium]